jgi:hypothetical protein
MITRMNYCIRSLINYFESVLHPAGGSNDNPSTKARKKTKNQSLLSSPESVNIRGAIVKKQDKLRRNPAP